MMKNFYIKVVPVVDKSVRKLCRCQYPLHPKGCPNWNKRLSCPPKAPMIYDTLDLSEDVYAIYNIFNYKSHVNKMRRKHPDWSDRQIKCVLYWQGTARKRLRGKIGVFKNLFTDYIIVMCPEAQGVNLTETMKNVGIILEWPPENLAYQIVLAGIERR